MGTYRCGSCGGGKKAVKPANKRVIKRVVKPSKRK